jgi:hypothetical protein
MVDSAQVKAEAQAFRDLRVLDEARYASISEMAAAEQIEWGYLGTLLRLTLLAPDVVEAILNGQAPSDLGLPRLLEPLPLSWMEHRLVLNGGGRALAHCRGDRPGQVAAAALWKVNVRPICNSGHGSEPCGFERSGNFWPRAACPLRYARAVEAGVPVPGSRAGPIQVLPHASPPP